MNRVSLGVQSLDPGILHLLGREHTPEQALHSVEMLDVYKRQTLSINFT